MPVPLKAQGQISSSWTLTEYKSTVHSLNIHVYSIVFQTPIPRGAAHVSGSFSSSSQLKSLSTVCKALCFRTSPPSSPHSFCLGYSDLLKLSKPPTLCLEGSFLKLGQGSPLSPCRSQLQGYLIQEAFPHQVTWNTPQTLASFSISFLALCFFVAHEITAYIIYAFASCCHLHPPPRVLRVKALSGSRLHSLSLRKSLIEVFLTTHWQELWFSRSTSMLEREK